jgi:acyl carrier protein
VNTDDVERQVRDVLARFAPEADLGALDPGASLQEELDIDSMDLLNVMIAVKEVTGVDVPESDYDQVATLAGLVAYVSART